MPSSRLSEVYQRDLYVIQDPNNPRASKIDTILPSTILDQVYDQLTPEKKTLRQILEELEYEIITGGRGNILFPVDSVNGKTGDVQLTKADVELGRVDNTADIDKPLSAPQREALLHILENYDFRIDTSKYDSHIIDTDNPHHVTVDQLDENDSLTDFVNHLINQHNLSTTIGTHMDIRRSLSRLWTLTNDIYNTVENEERNVSAAVEAHIGDLLAHDNLFAKKEDNENKVIAFDADNNNDNTKYPSTKAVYEFVLVQSEKLKNEFNQALQDIDVSPGTECERITDEEIIEAVVRAFGTISGGSSGSDSSTDYGDGYTWSDIGKLVWEDILNLVDTGTINPDEVSVSVSNVRDALEKYYTKEYIDALEIPGQIKFLPGTQDGTFRYYYNNDMHTMSEDVHIAGLKRLAYLEWITEGEIADNAVHSRHILNRAIEKRHISDGAVHHNHVTMSPDTILGNIDPNSNLAQEIPLSTLSDKLLPMIQEIFRDGLFDSYTEEEIKTKVDNAFD